MLCILNSPYVSKYTLHFFELSYQHRKEENQNSFLFKTKADRRSTLFIYCSSKQDDTAKCALLCKYMPTLSRKISEVADAKIKGPTVLLNFKNSICLIIDEKLKINLKALNWSPYIYLQIGWAVVIFYYFTFANYQG